MTEQIEAKLNTSVASAVAYMGANICEQICTIVDTVKLF